jgi:hypothetical protein
MRLIEHHGDRTARVLLVDHPTVEQCRQYVVQEVVAYGDGQRIVVEYPVTGWMFWATKDQVKPPC